MVVMTRSRVGRCPVFDVVSSRVLMEKTSIFDRASLDLEANKAVLDFEPSARGERSTGCTGTSRREALVESCASK